jgi:hypothetical protein
MVVVMLFEFNRSMMADIGYDRFRNEDQYAPAMGTDIDPN